MARMTAFSPDDVSRPFGAYNQAVLVDDAARWLIISGQLGLNAAGELEVDFEAQTRRIFLAIDACLREAGMERSNIVKLSTWLTSLDDRPAYMKIRDGWVASPPPASTLLFVPALAVPGARIEVEAMAAA